MRTSFLCKGNKKRTARLQHFGSGRSMPDRLEIGVAGNGRLSGYHSYPWNGFILRDLNGFSTTRTDDTDDIEADLFADLRQRQGRCGVASNHEHLDPERG